MRWTEKTVHVEKKVAHGNPRVLVCSIHGVSMGLTAHGLLRSLSTSVDIDIYVYVFSIIYCIGDKNWALHGEQWVYEQVKIVSTRRCVNHFVRLHILEEEFIIRLYVIDKLPKMISFNM